MTAGRHPAGRPRRWPALVFLTAGALVLALTLGIEPGDARFYPATIGLAGLWVVGAGVSGPLRLHGGGLGAREWLLGLGAGGVLLAVCLVGATVVNQVHALREPVNSLLDHARFGSLAGVLAITVMNGVAEELFFRGALFEALADLHPVPLSALLYALTTVGSGVPLLVVAAALVGLVAAWLRVRTGGVLIPVVTHLIWSVGMLLLLPHVLQPHVVGGGR